MIKIARPWTDEDFRTLNSALDEGLSSVRTALKMKRTTAAVVMKARKVGRKFKTSHERKRGKLPTAVATGTASMSKAESTS